MKVTKFNSLIFQIKCFILKCEHYKLHHLHYLPLDTKREIIMLCSEGWQSACTVSDTDPFAIEPYERLEQFPTFLYYWFLMIKWLNQAIYTYDFDQETIAEVYVVCREIMKLLSPE